MSDNFFNDAQRVVMTYALFIAHNLPEWNHSKASSDSTVMMQKICFLQQANQIDDKLPIKTQLQQLGKIVAINVPDNHIDILDNQGKSVVPKQMPEYPCDAFNVACQPVLNLKDICQIQVQEDKTPWLIATQSNGTNTTGIVAIPSFGGNIEQQTEKRRQFINTFFQEKQKHHWDSIIFDLRGNTGGDAEIIKEISERMSRRPLKYADVCEVISPRVDNPIQKEIFSQKEHISESHVYTGSETDRFKGDICVLQDGWNASATEGAIYILSQLGAKTIGEMTSGTFAGGCCVEVPMSHGFLTIGTEYRTRNKNGKPIQEKEGIIPDIKCSSPEALNQAFKYIQQKQTKNKSLIGFLSSKVR